MTIMEASDEFRQMFYENSSHFKIYAPESVKSLPRPFYDDPGVYIIFGTNQKILQVGCSTIAMGTTLTGKLGPNADYGNFGSPTMVSAIMLDDNSKRFAPEIKRLLKCLLSPAFK